jgi:hypothetical protein
MHGMITTDDDDGDNGDNGDNDDDAIADNQQTGCNCTRRHIPQHDTNEANTPEAAHATRRASERERERACGHLWQIKTEGQGTTEAIRQQRIIAR